MIKDYKRRGEKIQTENEHRGRKKRQRKRKKRKTRIERVESKEAATDKERLLS